MEMVRVKRERKAQLDEYARRDGQQDTVEAIRKGYEDVKAGRTRPPAEFLEELRVRHGFPR